MPATPDATNLLVDLREGDREAVDRLFPLVYEELRRLAHLQRRRLQPGQTLNTTALVHEAYLKLVDQTRTGWNDRAHFLAVCARAMRQIVLNYARRQSAQKRGGGRAPLPLDEGRLARNERAGVLVALDEALTQLTKRDERMGRVVECRFFGGLTEKEIGHVLEVSERTVRRDWRKAKRWLAQALSRDAA